VLRAASCNQDCYTKEASPAELDAHLRESERSGRWHDHVLPALSAMTCRAPQQLRLAPTARSLLR